MATLTGTKIKDTYKSLVKVTDNAEAGTTGKQLSDGNGNNLGLYVDTDGVFGIGAAASLSLDISSKTDAVGLPVGTDANRPTGGAGQIRYNTTDGKLEFYDSAWRHVASESYVNTEIANLIDSSPSTLDTLNEIAAALNDDANFHTTITNLIDGKQSIVTIAVTVSGGKFYIDGTQQQTVTLGAGITYRFDQSDASNSGHPLQFSTTSDGTHNSGSAYTTGVTVSGTAGSTDAYVQIITEQDTPKLYYYCTQHSGMGGALSHLSDKQDTITGAATTITSSDLTADRALLSNGSGKVAVSDITSTELGYLDGVTSNIQTQIDGIGGSQDVFKTIAVAGQSDVVADSTTDSLTLAGASGITITTDASSDTITFTGSGGGGSGLSWQSTAKTANFSASANEGYFINLSSAITMTLPSSPSVGDKVGVIDYAGNFATYNLTITSSDKIRGNTADVVLDTNDNAVSLVYSGTTKGWLLFTSAVEGDDPLEPASLDIQYLVVAGGGGGGYGAAGSGGGGGAGGFRSGTLTNVTPSTNFTIQVGNGGSGSSSGTPAENGRGDSGGNSIFSSITSNGGGGGGYTDSSTGGRDGGSGGGGGGNGGAVGAGDGNTPATDPSQGNDGGNASAHIAGAWGAGGGGGSGSAGGAGDANNAGEGGTGSTTSIITKAQADAEGVGETDSSNVYFSSGGGGGSWNSGYKGTASIGGGGNGGEGAPSGGLSTGSNGADNTGGGAGGGGQDGTGGDGGSGVVILKYPDSYTLSGLTGLTESTNSPLTITGYKISIFKSGSSTTVQIS